jgi:hypothetical protein
VTFEAVRGRIDDAGLACRGGFHPRPEDGVPVLPDGGAVRTLVLLGFVGDANWAGFAASEECRDGRADPLDRWSRRVVDGLARSLGAAAFYPFGGPPWLRFHEWAQRAEPVFPSPLGILIHPVWGLWHSYRGALGFADRIKLPAPAPTASPCDSCAARPCLDACPVGAFVPGRYDVAACVGHIGSPAGADCLAEGCAARRACPIGADRRYGTAQAAFHMHSFHAAQR